MNLRPLIPAATLLLPVAAQDPFTHEANGFLFSIGDFNNDSRQDLVLVDQSTGTIRLATQQANGSLTWGEAQPSGIESPGALAVGRFFIATHDAIALGSAVANRIHLFGISNPAELFNPTAIFPTAPGPLSLAAFNVDATGTTDLVAIGEGLAPLTNKGSGRVYEAITTLNGTPATTWSTSFPQATRRINPVRPKPGTAPRIAEIYGPWGGESSIFYLESVGPAGLSTSISGGTIPSESRYSIGSLDASTLTHIFSWVPDQTILRCQRVNESTPGVFTLATAVNHTLPAPIRQVVPIQQGAGARIAVLFGNGSVRIYQFDGSSAPVEIATPHPSGADFLLPIGSADLLIASGLRTSSPTWRRLTLFGGAYVNASFGSLPPAKPSAQTSNILFLSAEPFVNEGVAPKALRQFRDWTTTATPASGIAWTVQSLAFSSSVAGLSAPQSITLSATNAADFPLLSQYAPAVSIHSLDPRLGTDLADIVFDPPPGLYNTPATAPSVPNAPPAIPTPVVSVRIAATEPGFTLHFRESPTGDYSLVPDDGIIPVTATTTFQVYGKSGPRRTPVRTATYIIATPPPLGVPTAADADADGLPDAWEAAFNLSDPNGDADLDGYTNLEEAIAGGDPHVFGYLKNLPPVLTGSFITVGAQQVFRLEWPAADDVSQLQATTTLNGWAPLPSPPVISLNKHRVDIPLNGTTPARFFRLTR